MIPNNINAILASAIDKARQLVINQVRYQLPAELIPANDPDSWYFKADAMNDEQTLEFIKDTDILSNTNLIQLIADMGLETLYDEDNVDAVSSYISAHKDDCKLLHQYLLTTGE